MIRSNSEGSARRRPISVKRFNKIEAVLRTCSQTFATFVDAVIRLEEIVATRSIIVQPAKKGDEPVTVKLSTAEVDGYKLQHKQAKLSKKQAKKALTKAETDYKDACKHNAACVMDKAKKFNAKLAGEHKAKREKNTRKDVILTIVNTLKAKADPEYIALLDVANDGREFRKVMDAILKQQDEETYVTISGLSSVKTEIYNDVKEELLADKDDQDNEADVVPAG